MCISTQLKGTHYHSTGSSVRVRVVSFLITTVVLVVVVAVKRKKSPRVILKDQ